MPRPRKAPPQPKRGGKPGPHAKHGEGSIHPVGNRWRGAATVELPDGTRKRVYVYGATPAEAERLLARKRAAYGDEPLPDLAPGDSVRTFLVRWLDDVVRLRSRLSTYETYSIVLKSGARGIANLPLTDVTPTVLQRLYGEMDRADRPVSYIRHVHAILSGAFRQAVAWGLLPTNPCVGVRLPRAERREYTTVTPEQLRQVLAESARRKLPLTAYWLLVATTGIRRSEGIGLRWQDVDIERGTITINGQLLRSQTEGMYWQETKSRAGRRTITLMDAAIATLRLHREQQDAARAAAKPAWAPQPYVFLTARGQPFRDDMVNGAWSRLRDWCGLPKTVRPHDLRHTVASMLMARGVNPRVVQELMGHSKVETTLAIYGHVMPGMHEAAIRGLEDVFRGSFPALDSKLDTISAPDGENLEI